MREQLNERKPGDVRKRPDVIHSMRTYFKRADQKPIDSITFAEFTLRQVQTQAARQSSSGILSIVAEALGAIRLGDPMRPMVGSPVIAYINAGRWLARCECGGCEFVDLEQPLFMCCSCWNAGVGHRWRVVRLPRARAEIEAVLLARPKENRHFADGDTVEQLRALNVAHGLTEEVVSGELD